MPSDLIARLEAAGPEWDSRVDEEIARAIGWQEEADGWHAVGIFSDDGRLRRTAYAVDVPPFTRSLDAAMTLLGPPGYPLWTVTLSGRSHGIHGTFWTAEVTVPSSEFRGQSSVNPALAVCVAALRARTGR